MTRLWVRAATGIGRSILQDGKHNILPESAVGRCPWGNLQMNRIRVETSLGKNGRQKEAGEQKEPGGWKGVLSMKYAGRFIPLCKNPMKPFLSLCRNPMRRSRNRPWCERLPAMRMTGKKSLHLIQNVYFQVKVLMTGWGLIPSGGFPAVGFPLPLTNKICCGLL